jgi:hypothetical protein
MADSDVALAQAHMRQQVKDVAVVQRALGVAFDRMIDPSRPYSNFGDYLKFALRIIEAGRAKGTITADRYYQASRLLGGVGGKLPAFGRPEFEPDRWAASLRATGPANIYDRVVAGQTPTEAKAFAQVATLSAAKRLILDAPRAELIDLTRRDTESAGWARVSDGKPCYFCAMLVSRGPVYSEDTVRFIAHDGCGCSVRSVWKKDPTRGWDKDAKALAAMWKETGADGWRSAYTKSISAPGATLSSITKGT